MVVIFLIISIVLLCFIDLFISLPKYKKDLSFWTNELNSYKTEIIETQYGKIEYLESGEGEPILVSHGINGGFDQCLGLSEMYIGKGYNIISVSRFGYMGSTLPEDSSPEAQADAFASLIDHLNIDRVYIFGNSAGGTSAIQFALRHPDRCKGLILLSSNVPSEESLPPKPLMRMIFGSNFLYWKIVTTFNKSMLSMFIPPDVKSSLSDESIDKLTNKILISGLPVDLRTAGYLNDMYISNPAINTGYQFKDINIPTLIIHAVDDPAPPYKGAIWMSKEIPDIKMVSFKSGGHLILGHEDEIKGEIDSFVDGLENSK